MGRKGLWHRRNTRECRTSRPEQGRKNEEEKSGGRRAEPQAEIWGKEEGWLPEREPLSPVHI